MRTPPNIILDIPLLKRLYEQSTDVVAWYPNGDQVRGPFGRWFTVSEVDPHYQRNVAFPENDVLYCAMALNAVPHLIARIDELETKLDSLYEDVP